MSTSVEKYQFKVQLVDPTTMCEIPKEWYFSNKVNTLITKEGIIKAYLYDYDPVTLKVTHKELIVKYVGK